MMVRFIFRWFLLRPRRPWKDPLFGQMIDLCQQRRAAFNPLSAGALVTPILQRPLSHRGPVRRGHGVKTRLALLAAGQDPSFVEFAQSTTTGGLAAFSAQPIERPRNHGSRTDEFGEDATQDREGTAELLPEF